MPIEVVRFGVGHRRPQGPAGTMGIEGRVIHSDARGVIAELAFARGGAIAPHSNPNVTWLVVIEGGGWVQVGDERIRVQAGDAVLWPADIDHWAWTEHTAMRALVVEFAEAAAAVPAVVEGVTRALPNPGGVSRGEGQLRPRRIQRHGPSANLEGEPS
ncbi:MAG TPA: cupin domain-containing protein [Candidatus Limnocylindrales bacterium]|nr:cupin domain-containing protein [Candidatus Limnocylindrales bacterium]